MRLRFVSLFILCFFIFLSSRIYYLSIKSNIYYEEMAKQNAIKIIDIPPVRGFITDRNGELLAVNDLGFSVMLKQHLYIKKKNRKILNEELENLALLFEDFNVSTLLKNYVKKDSYYNQDYISVIDFVPYNEMMRHISELSLRENIEIRSSNKRHYPYGKSASHIIGYIGRANQQDESDEIAKLTGYIGKSGIERFYNEALQGKKGIRELKVNALGKEIEELQFTKPHSQDLNLSIDIRLQAFLSELFEGNAGVAIIMDANTGALLAGGSFPEYDPNSFVGGISVKEWKELNENPDHPFTNKMINGLYPPGSVVKMGVGLAFLQSRSINAYTQFFCSGGFEFGDRVFRCWNRSGHGAMDLKHAIKHSCDVYFYEGSSRAGIDLLSQTLGKIGFGAKTGIDLPNEFVGIMPSKEWKMRRYKQEWFQGETLNTAIGQGDFLVTPLQIAKYTAQIAVGKGIVPHIFDGANVSEPEPFTSVQKTQLPLLREAMNAVTNEVGGTAYRFFRNLPISVAGKTGTAQVVGFSQAEKKNIRELDLEYYSRSHTWLTSFAPYKEPKIVVTVLLEHGGRTLSSGIATRTIYEKLLELGYLQKEE